MTKRIFISICSMSVALIVLVAGVSLSMCYQFFYQENEARLEREALILAHGASANGVSYLQNAIVTEDRITWVAADGRVLFDSETDVSTLNNHANRQEILDALQYGEGLSVRYSDTVEKKTMYYAVLLDNKTILRVSSEFSSIVALFSVILAPTLLCLFGVLVFSFFVAMEIAKKITHPINAIDLEHPEFAMVYEELSPLVERISAQNQQIKAHISQLEVQQKNFHAITTNMKEGLFLLDEKNTILSFNDGALSLLQVEPPELNDSIYSCYRGEGMRTCVEAALRGEHHEENMTIGGRVCSFLANPVLDGEEVIGVVLMILDITEKEEREHLRREFTANVSHELKTPLSSISGFAELMKNGMVKPEDTANFAGKIYKEAQHLIGMIQDILRLSQLDEKNEVFVHESVDVYDVAQEVLTRLQLLAEQHEVDLTIGGESAMITGVKPVLQELIFNLCENGIRYNTKGGCVSVSVANHAKTVNIAIVDTGIGIAKSEQSRIFERFYRVDKSRDKSDGGTGLGLAIVKHGVALHNGVIQVDSTPREGTTILLEFPRGGGAYNLMSWPEIH